jgi:general secretion pathway protein J
VGQRGFTLLELLVATAVLALLGALSFRGLDSILEAEARVQAESRRWSDLSLFLAQLGEDMSMAVERAGRDGAGRSSPALLLRDATRGREDADEPPLALTRLGLGEGAAAQSAPRRIGYRLRDGRLEYLVWPALDAAPVNEPAVYEILDGISELHWQALDVDGRWVPEWPGTRSPHALPRAVVLRMVLAEGGEVSRILPVR